MDEFRIIRNSGKCLICEQDLVSKHRHDGLLCKCGNIFIDGGNCLLSRSAKQVDKFLDTSIIDPPDWFDRIREDLEKKKKEIKEDPSSKYKKLIDLVDDLADQIDMQNNFIIEHPTFEESKQFSVNSHSLWYSAILQNYHFIQNMQKLLKIREKFRNDGII